MKVALVTVGSTQFPQLIEAVIQKELIDKLAESGFLKLIIQYGSCKPKLPSTNSRLKIESFNYTPDLSDYIKNADLIIAHAGAGTAIEALRAGRKLIIVPNESLLDNHQLELSRKLSSSFYCLSCKPNDIIFNVTLALKTDFLPFPTFEQDVIQSIFV